MIPGIGIIIGLYVVTRMLQLLLTASTPGSGVERVTKIMAMVTLLVTLLVIADLLLRGTGGFGLGDVPDLAK
jgi:hypothetical protein